jgi:hypothetical protein
MPSVVVLRIRCVGVVGRWSQLRLINGPSSWLRHPFLAALKGTADRSEISTFGVGPITGLKPVQPRQRVMDLVGQRLTGHPRSGTSGTYELSQSFPVHRLSWSICPNRTTGRPENRTTRNKTSVQISD